jgi:hypothetical protein
MKNLEIASYPKSALAAPTTDRLICLLRDLRRHPLVGAYDRVHQRPFGALSEALDIVLGVLVLSEVDSRRSHSIGRAAKSYFPGLLPGTSPAAR